MLSRRLGLAARLGQSAASSVLPSGLRVASIASTSYDQQRQGACSVRGMAFTPVAQAGKKRAAKVDPFANEGEEEEGSNEDDELFSASGGAETVTRASVHATKTKRKESFEKCRETLLSKLDEGAHDKTVLYTLGKGNWTEMVLAARDADHLRSCLDVARKWNAVAYPKSNNLEKVGAAQTTAFIHKAHQLRCPEISYYAVTSPVSGLDYNISLIRRVQASLVEKLLRLCKAVRSAGAEEAKKELLESENFEGAVKLAEEWESDKGSDEDRATLSLVDRTLALSAMTSATSQDMTTIDSVALLTAVRGMVGVLERTKADDYFASMIKKRILTALDVFVKQAKLQSEQPLSPGEERLLLDGCTKTVDYLLVGLNGARGAHKQSSLVSMLYRTMEQCDEAIQNQFSQETEKKLERAAAIQHQEGPKQHVAEVK